MMRWETQMFDDVMGLMKVCTGRFTEGATDAFASSIVAEVLTPILKDIDSLRSFSEGYQRQVLIIDGILEEAQILQARSEGPET